MCTRSNDSARKSLRAWSALATLPAKCFTIQPTKPFGSRDDETVQPAVERDDRSSGAVGKSPSTTSATSVTLVTRLPDRLAELEHRELRAAAADLHRYDAAPDHQDVECVLMRG